MTNTPLLSKQHFQLAPSVRFFRISMDEYHDLIERNILTTLDRFELLEELLVQKTPQSRLHFSTVMRLTRILSRLCPDDWQLLIQLPITLRTSEPEPDAAIVRGESHSFDSRRPGASDFGIIIEVADSSLMLDRREKGRIYAEAGIPEYWVVNLPDRQIEVYTSPDSTGSPPAYRQRTDYAESDSVPLGLDGQIVGHVAVGGLLPAS